MAMKESRTFQKLPYGICALLLGGIGVNDFIAGKTGWGIVKILLCWTFIPAIISFVQGIMALCRPEAWLKQTGLFKFEGGAEDATHEEYKVY